MIKKLTGEVWKPLQFPGWKQLRKKYALSSMGRVASYSEDVLADGKLLNGSLTTGYKTLNLHRPGNNGTLYIHREIARLFLNKSTLKHKYVIHLNHNKLDNCGKKSEMGNVGRNDRSSAKKPCKDRLQKSAGKPHRWIEADCQPG